MSYFFWYWEEHFQKELKRHFSDNVEENKETQELWGGEVRKVAMFARIEHPLWTHTMQKRHEKDCGKNPSIPLLYQTYLRTYYREEKDTKYCCVMCGEEKEDVYRMCEASDTCRDTAYCQECFDDYFLHCDSDVRKVDCPLCGSNIADQKG